MYCIVYGYWESGNTIFIHLFTDEREEKDLQTEFQQRLSELQENVGGAVICCGRNIDGAFCGSHLISNIKKIIAFFYLRWCTVKYGFLDKYKLIIVHFNMVGKCFVE